MVAQGLLKFLNLGMTALLLLSERRLYTVSGTRSLSNYDTIFEIFTARLGVVKIFSVITQWTKESLYIA